MIRSMTGFARKECTAPFGVLAWELRTVNHRYLETSMRLPEDLRAAEGEFRQAVAAAIRRGKVDATLYFRPAQEAVPELETNDALVHGLVERALVIRRRLGEDALINVMDLLRWPGVVRERERDVSPLLVAAQGLLKEALESLTASRAGEGGRIAEMLLSRCATIEEITHKVAARLPEVRTRIRAKLLEQELDRLRSHVAEARSVIGGGEPAGRKLDFLMQEFNREANTLSSKSQDAETTRAAVDLKVLIEQMREQVQNVE
jgi:uncharacterized protein (TIGR00255 family)